MSIENLNKPQIFCEIEDLLQAKSINIGDIVEFGRYPQTAAGSDQTPIKWYIIKKDDNNLMLLSQYILDAMPLDEDRRNSKIWHDCNLRKWLNHTFLQTVFDEKERAMIVKNVCKDNGEKIMYDKYSTAEKDTEDFVFLLSDAERNMIEENLGRRTHVAGTATDFAKQRGIFVCKDNGFSSWWLRTRSDDRYRGSFQTMFVECREGYVTYPYDDDKYFEDHAGELDHRGDTPYGIKRGVRPAIVITGQDF